MYYITETINGTVTQVIDDFHRNRRPTDYLREMITALGHPCEEPTSFHEFYLDSKGGQHVEFEIHEGTIASDEHITQMIERYK